MTRSRSLREVLRAPAVGLPMVGLLGIVAVPASAQDVPPVAAIPRAIAFTPTLSVLETYTDNRFLTAGDRRSSLITQISPGVRLRAQSSRVQGDLDYSLNAYGYSHGSGSNDLQNALDGRLRIEAVENRAFIDASARIAQQSISAFGTQTPDPSLQNANQSEVGTYSVSPSLRGSFGGLADYEARASYQIVHSDGFDAANSRTNGASFRLRSDPSSTARLGWSLAATHEGIAYEQTRSTVSDRLEADLEFAATPEIVLSLGAGRESSNLASFAKESETTWAYGVRWRPSERTRVSYTRDKRIFGSSHAGLVEFRTPRTVWRYIDTQDVTTSAGTAVGSAQTAYDLLFTQYASLYPDPALRAQMVDATLAGNGIARGTLVDGGFLSAAPSLQRRREVSVALTGPRLTTILSAFETRTSLLGPLAQGTPDDLTTRGRVRQRGLGASVAYRLTPDSTANAVFSLLRSSAAVAAFSTDQRSVLLSWTTRLGPHTHVTLSGRRSTFSSPTSPYHESALIAGLGFQF